MRILESMNNTQTMIMLFYVLICIQVMLCWSICLRNDYNISFHFVIGGYKENSDIRFLQAIGITNAEVFQYVRERQGLSFDSRSGMLLPHSHTARCNISFHRVALINHGREALAFYDHVSRYYDMLPDALVFMHGHIGTAWHTGCWTIYSRVRRYYYLLQEERKATRSLERIHDMMTPNMSKYMVTLTSHQAGGFEPSWYGWRKDTHPLHYDVNDTYLPASSFRRLQTTSSIPATPSHINSYPDNRNLSSYNVSNYHNWSSSDEEEYSDRMRMQCYDMLLQYGMIMTRRDQAGNAFCCGTFIAPRGNILRHPRALYQSYAAFISNPVIADQVSGRDCFEFVIYYLLGNDTMTPEESRFYEDAQYIDYTGATRFLHQCYEYKE